MNTVFSRRAAVQSLGALTVSIMLPDAPARAAVFGVEQRPPLKPDQLSTYVSIGADGTATAYFGKMDMGQGTDIGVAQMVAEELDLSPERVLVVMGDTATSINQGGASGSTGIQRGGMALRHAAAEARRVLLDMAAQQLGTSADRLVVTDGVVSVSGSPGQQVTYAKLIGGRFFDVQIGWNGKIGNDLDVSGKAHPKTPDQYKVVGQPVRRRDVPLKVFGTGDYVVDIKVPGMLHARMIRPPVAGSIPTAVDRDSIKDIPGAQVVWDKGLLGVLSPREWDAIRASNALRVTWSDSHPNFPRDSGIYDAIRNASVVKRGVEVNVGDVDAALASGARLIEATYQWPFQSHSSMGPACAVVDYRPDGLTTVWTGSQKPHYAGACAANILGLPPEKVRAIWVPGPGSYGRNDAGDAVADAAVLSKAVGKPVRVQGMRHEGTGWDPKGPASIHVARAAVSPDGNVLAWDFLSKGFSRLDVNSNESAVSDTLAGQLLGVALKPTPAFNAPEESYGFPSKRKAWETVPPLMDRASPLRSTHLRDPLGPQIHFASESFIDELAYALAQDPVEFRLKYVRDPRDVAVVRAAADKGEWQRRTAARRQAHGDTATGQGIAYVQRTNTRVAIVAEVDVDLKTGKIWARRFTVAHDCGQIINPELLRLTIEGNIVQGVSRAMWEEVRFDDKNVTSVDWLTYPILDMTEAPERIDVVLINRPELAPSGAGEASTRPVAAAVANAVYDATGVRFRQAPLTPDRLKAGMS